MNVLLLVVIIVVLILLALIACFWFRYNNKKKKIYNKLKGSAPTFLDNDNITLNNPYFKNHIKFGDNYYSLFKNGVRSVKYRDCFSSGKYRNFLSLVDDFIRYDLIKNLPLNIKKSEITGVHEKNINKICLISEGTPDIKKKIKPDGLYFVIFYLKDTYISRIQNDPVKKEAACEAIRSFNGLFEYWVHKEYFIQYKDYCWFVSDEALIKKIIEQLTLNDDILNSLNFNKVNKGSIVDHNEFVIFKNDFVYIDERQLKTLMFRFLLNVFAECDKHKEDDSIDPESCFIFIIDDIPYSLLSAETNKNCSIKYADLIQKVNISELTLDDIGMYVEDILN